MKSFHVMFTGWRPGWVGPSTQYSLTVKAEDSAGALALLSQSYRIDKVAKIRELGVKRAPAPARRPVAKPASVDKKAPAVKAKSA